MYLNLLVDWLSASPDLNPLDSKLWSVLEGMICTRHHYNLQSLKQVHVEDVDNLLLLRDLSPLEHGGVVSTRERGHSISEVSMGWGFSCMTISRVHCEYRESGKISSLQNRCGQKKILQKWDCRESFNVTKVQPFCKLLQISMLGHPVSACEPFNEISSIWAFGVEGSPC